ncbi:MAG: hypothetical protein ACAI35_00720 [Candidatus Methylacidiphilales bacterium]|nr:hypothetical protein [Candidatus Methylacidiphilales bacterium]
MRIKPLALSLLVATTALFSPVLSSVFAEDKSTSLVANGDFEGQGGWALAKAQIVEEDGKHFLRLQATEPNVQIQAHQRITLSGEPKKLTLKFRFRHDTIQAGAQNWHDGRLLVHFKNTAGEILKPDPKPIAFRGSSVEWSEKVVELPVPEASATVEILFGLFQTTSGTLEVDDVTLTPSE